MTLAGCLSMAHQKNPKQHDVHALIASFRRFGFVAFPTIDEATQVMVAGHGRCEALSIMKEAGESPPHGIGVGSDGDWTVPIVRGISFRDERERDAYVVADNQHTIRGGWDFDRLSELLGELRADVDGFGFDGMGFDAVDLDGLLESFGGSGETPGDDPPKDDDKPEKFVRHDINVETTYCCPKCGYEWSGKAK